MNQKSVLRLGVAMLAVVCSLQMASADVYAETDGDARAEANAATAETDADALWDKLDDLLFLAGENADIAAAKHVADDLRRLPDADTASEPLGDMYRGKLKTVDACYAAGEPESSQAEQQAILSDPHIGKSFTPNTNMKLAEGFANGWGVKPDLKRATAYACHANDVPAELMAQVDSLEKHDFTGEKPFAFCSYITSGLNAGYCAGFDAELADKVRDTKITALTTGYSVAEQAAFARLRKAAETFFEAHASLEQDMTGTARDVFFTQWLRAEKKLFLKNLRSFEAGTLPPPNPAEYARTYDLSQADSELNRQYRKIMRHKFDPDAMTGTVTKDGIRKTERAWIVYRDAWLSFARTRHPHTSSEPLRIWLTQQRTQVLLKQVTEELP